MSKKNEISQVIFNLIFLIFNIIKKKHKLQLVIAVTAINNDR